jgi:hypothetical protein
MVSVLVIGPKVCWFIPGRGVEFLRAIKITSTPSFGEEVKPSALCHKILRHVKNHFEVWTKIFRKPNSSFPLPSSSWFATRWLLLGLPESSGGRIRSFILSILFRHGSLHSSLGGWTVGPFVAAVQRHNLTPSTWSSSTYVTVFLGQLIAYCFSKSFLALGNTKIYQRIHRS